MRVVVSHEGETLDALLWRATGRIDILAAVLDANPHLARLPILLPAGVRIAIPDPPKTPTRKVVRLWD